MDQDTTMQQAKVLSEDMLRKCLSLLPVKDIVRQRILSKTLNSMLMDNYFVNLHLSRSPRNRILVEEVLAYTRSLRYFEMIDGNINDVYGGFEFNLESGWHPVTSCNGIVCCIRKVENHIYEDKPWMSKTERRQSKKYGRVENRGKLVGIQKGYHFQCVNPATREFSAVSPILISKTECRNPLIGFGFDLTNSVYKLVVLLRAAGGVSTRVFEVGPNLWRTVPHNFPGTPLPNTRDYRQKEFIKNGVFVNGTLNWLASRGDAMVYVSFHLAAETYTVKNLPDNANANIQKPNIGVLNNRISFTYFSEGRKFEIWRHKDTDDDNWMFVAAINFEDLQMSITEFEPSRVPLVLVDICYGDTLVLVRPRRNNMIFYNFKERAVLGFHTFESDRIAWVDDSSFVESLVSPIQG